MYNPRKPVENNVYSNVSRPFILALPALTNVRNPMSSLTGLLEYMGGRSATPEDETS